MGWSSGTTGGGGGGAPTNAEYVVTADSGSLTNDVVLGTAVIMYGDNASRPAASIEGRLYFDTDNDQLQRDNGSTWDVIGSLALSDLVDKDHDNLSNVTSDQHHTEDHASRHGSGQPDPITVATPVNIKKSGSVIGTRRGVNFIPGSNVTITTTDDAGNDEVDVTIASTGGGSGGVTLGAPSTNVDIGDDLEEGISAEASRADHGHGVPAPSAGYPEAVAESESDGVATAPARADHVHPHGSGYSPDAHHTKLHAADHGSGGADAITTATPLEVQTTAVGGGSVSTVGTNRTLRFIPGNSQTTITGTTVSNRTHITVSSTATGGSAPLSGWAALVYLEGSTVTAKRRSGTIIATDTNASGNDGARDVIQAAIDDVSSTGGTVFIAAGLYFIAGPDAINMSEGVTLRGEFYTNRNDGYAGTILRYADANQNTAQVIIDGTGSAFALDQIGLDGDNKIRDCLLLMEGPGSEVRTCGIKRANRYGIRLENGAGSNFANRIWDCWINNNNQGAVHVGSGSSDGTLSRCRILSNGGINVNLSGGWQFDGNHLTSSSATTGLLIDSTPGTFVINNYIDSVNQGPFIQVNNGNNTRIVGNHFEGKSASNSTAGMIVITGGFGVIIGNTFQGENKLQRAVQFSGVSSPQWSIIGNSAVALTGPFCNNTTSSGNYTYFGNFVKT